MTNEKFLKKVFLLEVQLAEVRLVCAEVYQILGALDGPVEALDNLVAVAQGRMPPHETLLPYRGKDGNDSQGV